MLEPAVAEEFATAVIATPLYVIADGVRMLDVVSSVAMPTMRIFAPVPTVWDQLIEAALVPDVEVAASKAIAADADVTEKTDRRRAAKNANALRHERTGWDVVMGMGLKRGTGKFFEPLMHTHEH